MEKIVTEIFDEIDKLLDRHTIMVPFQEGCYQMFFHRSLEVDIAKLKNNFRCDNCKHSYEDETLDGYLQLYCIKKLGNSDGSAVFFDDCCDSFESK